MQCVVLVARFGTYSANGRGHLGRKALSTSAPNHLLGLFAYSFSFLILSSLGCSGSSEPLIEAAEQPATNLAQFDSQDSLRVRILATN